MTSITLVDGIILCMVIDLIGQLRRDVMVVCQLSRTYYCSARTENGTYVG